MHAPDDDDDDDVVTGETRKPCLKHSSSLAVALSLASLSHLHPIFLIVPFILYFFIGLIQCVKEQLKQYWCCAI